MTEWATYRYVDATGTERSGEGEVTSHRTDDDGVTWIRVSNTYGFTADVALDHPEYTVEVEERG